MLTRLSLKGLIFKFSLVGFLFLACGLIYLDLRLPDATDLKDVRLQIPLKIYTTDRKLIAEFGEKRRNPVLFSQVPKTLVNAILATEDRRFYEHHGVDFRGLARAAVHVISTGRKGQGGSTITMQVARNFFLSRKKTYLRKINEILLAFKIDGEFSKDEILELYLNKIYFGKSAYGIGAAAKTYYGKHVDQLTLPQMAMLAGLPQAPSSINPLNNERAALKRRNHVLDRMFHYGFITANEYYQAKETPLTAAYHRRHIEVDAPYVAEMVRQQLHEKFGDDLYTQGYQVVTTVDSQLQAVANQAVQKGLIEYDQRHGYRGPAGHYNAEDFTDEEAIIIALKSVPRTHHIKSALITAVDAQGADALMLGQTKIRLALRDMRWARKLINPNTNYMGSRPRSTSDVLKVGDVVHVMQHKNKWRLTQIPKASAALVSLSPKNGGIQALVGGFDYTLSKFNRVIQARRQPGSNFKPFIYAAALDAGYTAATTINDAPVVIEHDPSMEFDWRPQNDTRRFYGPTRLRVGLTKSRNMVSIRLLQAIGIDTAIPYVQRFGFDPSELPRGLSLALGTNLVSPLALVSGYAVFANGGYRVSPHLIARIEDAEGTLLKAYQYPEVCTEPCGTVLRDAPTTDEPAVQASTPQSQKLAHHTLEEQPLLAQRVITPQVAYIMTSMLQDAIKTGTGRRALVLKHNNIAGKTGTTNEKHDAWYSGYSPDIVCTTWVGYDDPRSLFEYGAQAALPVWIHYMKGALEVMPGKRFKQPDDIVSVRIDPDSGMLAYPGQRNAIFEIFRRDHAPNQASATLPHPTQMGDTHDASTESLF